MDKAIEKFDDFINFWVVHNPSVSDKILFCIFRGFNSPMAIRGKLCNIAKGNLSNYCKALISHNMITRDTVGRAVHYALSAKGAERVKKLLEAINDSF